MSPVRMIRSGSCSIFRSLHPIVVQIEEMSVSNRWDGDLNALYVWIISNVCPGLVCEVQVGVADLCHHFGMMVGFVLSVCLGEKMGGKS